MSIFFTLLGKEWLEAWRDKRLLWLPIVMVLLAVAQPITYYFMPQILDMAGNLPPGSVIQIPTPSGEEVLNSTLSQFGVMGTAIIVLSVMGSISQERSSGVLALIMSRKVRPLQYIGSKWLTHAGIIWSSFALAYGLAAYYVVILFNPIPVIRILSGLFTYSIWILFVMTVTLCMGALFRKMAGIAGTSLLILGGFSLTNSLFPKVMSWSPASALSQASSFLINGKGTDSFVLMLCLSLGFIFCIFAGTVLAFKHYDSYS